MNYKTLIAGAVGGALTAARIDYLAFKSWKSFKDFYSYDWGTAAWRWFQGAAIGAVTAGGINGLL